MNSIKFLFFVFGLLLSSSALFGQFDKTTCQEILSSYKPENYQAVVATIEVAGTTSTENKSYYFDPKTLEFIYKEKYIIIKDKDNQIAAPYINIKCIRAFPKYQGTLATFDIYIK